MFKRNEWPFIGASGEKYRFSILPKSAGLPRAAGVYVLAYTQPRGHTAGWMVSPLHVGQADDMRLALGNGAELDRDRMSLWNSSFILLEPDASARLDLVRDLEGVEAVFV